MDSMRAYLKTSIPRLFLPYALVLTFTLSIIDVIAFQSERKQAVPGGAGISTPLPATLTGSHPTPSTTPLNHPPMGASLPLAGQQVKDTAKPITAGQARTLKPPLETVTMDLPVQAITVTSMLQPSPSPSPVSYGLGVQEGTPLSVPNFVHPELGCNWMGVGGQVFDIYSSPMTPLLIELGGNLNGEAVSSLSISGTAPAWGPGGYEFRISDLPIPSQGDLWIQVSDLAGNPLSEKFYLDTYGECERNTILMNIVQVKYEFVYYNFFPWMVHDYLQPVED